MVAIDRRLPAGVALGRALAAAVLMGVVLAVASFIGSAFGASASSSDPFGVRLIVAGSVGITVVAVILLLRRRWDRAPLAGIGLSGVRRDMAGFLLGLGVVSAAGVAVIAVLSLIGVARWSSFDLLHLLVFLATNAVVALLLEAIPEEVSIRGYALTALRMRYSRPVATVLNIMVFLCVPVVALGVQALLELLASADGATFSLAPGGVNPLMYYLTLAAFGFMLVYARDATASATVWTCIGAHLAWLTINRIVLGRATGVEVALGEGATLVFFAVYFSMAVVGFSILRGRAGLSKFA
ncbi:hypothetical protein CAI21_18655 [Alkalilimnicola ehrlichii]|uniref:CAAX prenyl protease 2/Lysostaphin resistance protein A-like domain-containing protein n=1 Tax=Alkalilimnicola ehrlichii TaxID=351052 RepID=A0A3E0WJP5_9GAMM|nr:CPBP family glutamic-type intramembrane protease [Alkalilimnicola ehrlichii]RFA25553.1 hypothetical protein CAI21_18655 [Alkalilimnicola ehrlichii]RFA32679.1 hypothetical protein CAL65_18910 [Alkalilimnicola ehrlichii]